MLLQDIIQYTFPAVQGKSVRAYSCALHRSLEWMGGKQTLFCLRLLEEAFLKFCCIEFFQTEVNFYYIHDTISPSKFLFNQIWFQLFI